MAARCWSADEARLPARRRSALLALGSALALVMARLLPEGGSLPTVCAWRWVTGVPCPSCGMTRAFVALSHGHVPEAVAFNLASPAVYALAWLLAAGGLLDALDGRDRIGRAWGCARRPLAAAAFLLMGCAWALNLRASTLGGVPALPPPQAVVFLACLTALAGLAGLGSCAARANAQRARPRAGGSRWRDEES
jgi:hypothetical protein